MRTARSAQRNQQIEQRATRLVVWTKCEFYDVEPLLFGGCVCTAMLWARGLWASAAEGLPYVLDICLLIHAPMQPGFV